MGVFAENACTGGLEDAHTVVVTMISGRRMSRMTKPIRECHHGRFGLTGINRENRRTGAEAEHSIWRITARALKNIKDQP